MIDFYTNEEYQILAEMYRLGKIKKLSYLYRGYGKCLKVSAITTKGKFVISKNKLSNRKTISAKSRESLQYEIDMLETLKGMSVPIYLKSAKGNYIEKFKDGWVTVDKFYSGKWPKKMTSKMAHNLGLFLGEFHKRGVKFKKILETRRRFYDLSPDIMKKMKPYAYRQTNPILKSVVKIIEKGVIDNRPTSKLPIGPIHVDIGFKNELFVGEKLSAVVDFGNFYLGPLMVDVGKTIMFNCCFKGKLNSLLLKEFIAGYDRKRRMSKEEEAYLKKSILYAIYSHIWVDLYHVPIKYVPEKYTLYLVETFLPVARIIEKELK
ncbi:MAG: phosphotransferase [Patescibacteria group bacterium]